MPFWDVLLYSTEYVCSILSSLLSLKEFAGSGVIGLTGGTLALVASLVMGPRWDRRGESRWRLLPPPEGHNATVRCASAGGPSFRVLLHCILTSQSDRFGPSVLCCAALHWTAEYTGRLRGGVRSARRRVRQSGGHERGRRRAQLGPRCVQPNGSARRGERERCTSFQVRDHKIPQMMPQMMFCKWIIINFKVVYSLRFFIYHYWSCEKSTSGQLAGMVSSLKNKRFFKNYFS